MKKQRMAVLIILDGWGVSENADNNAIVLSRPRVYNNLMAQYSHTLLEAHGKSVGLPDGQVGNSEAGHMNIGAGRIVKQDSVYISEAILDGSFFKNPAFVAALQTVKKNGSKLHIMGILSGMQCPHMSPDHVVALLKMSDDREVSEVVVHCFTDGRDSPPDSALQNWHEHLQPYLTKNARLGSVSGRLYLDRKEKWQRTKDLYAMFTLGEAKFFASTFESAVRSGYERGETDEFISPTLIQAEGKNNLIENGDAVIFYNLRSDRARQLTMAFVQPLFDGFHRQKTVHDLQFVTMTDFGPDLSNCLAAYPSRLVRNSLPFVMKEYRQLYIAEMEKYAHMTVFINGGYPDAVAGEKRILVRSKDVLSYDEVPEMSAREITQVVLSNIKYDVYNFIVVNYANADMLGHTGNVEAAIAGVQVVDRCMGEIIEKVVSKGGLVMVTSDHGNAEYMQDAVSGSIDTMHETNLVPLILIDPEKRRLKDVVGKLADVAPTLLSVLNIPVPPEMTGNNLLIN
ncbi:MAG: 2,3-bisphosphoglycerate-independent phosphoglycerate mutase [Parcubacteria group bacterium GW2011_GWA2_44_12]|nr:MAG: 2,3-bisphosphoglycerate-independent phosphoglycerate mutase [Parcubacteria group bacterium GW2011_GWA2_44_12]